MMKTQLGLYELYSVVLGVINGLETIHAAGYTYNDLKLENIMLKGNKVKLIDFGFCQKYIDTDGNHIAEEE